MFSLPFLEELTGFINLTALDDAFDALSCGATSFFFIISALLLKFGAGSEMDCWIPQHYSTAWEEFAENYCFLQDTFWYPTNEHMADIMEHRLSYYQWTCVYFTFAAFFSMLPKFIWMLSQNLTDMPILYFCETTAKIDKQTQKEREEKLAELAELLKCKLAEQHSKYSLSRVRPIIVYGFIKILYIIIALLQFLMLGYFLGLDEISWGLKLASNIYNEVSWEQSGMFPRVTFCNFTVLMHGNNRNESIECKLGLSEFHEGIFLFLWFWLFINFLVAVLGSIYVFVVFNENILTFSLLHRFRNRNDHFEMTELKKFVNEVLKYDGQLVLSFVKSQSDAVAQELVGKMWKVYKEELETSSLSNADSSQEESDSDAENDGNYLENDSGDDSANDSRTKIHDNEEIMVKTEMNDKESDSDDSRSDSKNVFEDESVNGSENNSENDSKDDFEDASEKDFENASEEESETKSKDNSENNSENNSEDDFKDASEDDSENDSEDDSENDDEDDSESESESKSEDESESEFENESKNDDDKEIMTKSMMNDNDELL